MFLQTLQSEWLYRNERNGQISYLEILLCPLGFCITVFRLLFFGAVIITVGVFNSLENEKKEQVVIKPLFNFFFQFFLCDVVTFSQISKLTIFKQKNKIISAVFTLEL